MMAGERAGIPVVWWITWNLVMLTLGVVHQVFVHSEISGGCWVDVLGLGLVAVGVVVALFLGVDNG